MVTTERPQPLGTASYPRQRCTAPAYRHIRTRRKATIRDGMGTDWSLVVLFAAEMTFAALFVRSFSGYLRRRDPLQRDITWVFLPPTVLFVASVAEALPGRLPAWI